MDSNLDDFWTPTNCEGDAGMENVGDAAIGPGVRFEQGRPDVADEYRLSHMPT